MIPEFNRDGNLPEGIYIATIDEFLNRFATTSARRKWLGKILEELFILAKSTGKIKKIFVWILIRQQKISNAVELWR